MLYSNRLERSLRQMSAAQLLLGRGERERGGGTQLPSAGVTVSDRPRSRSVPGILELLGSLGVLVSLYSSTKEGGGEGGDRLPNNRRHVT